MDFRMIKMHRMMNLRMTAIEVQPREMHDSKDDSRVVFMDDSNVQPHERRRCCKVKLNHLVIGTPIGQRILPSWQLWLRMSGGVPSTHFRGEDGTLAF